MYFLFWITVILQTVANSSNTPSLAPFVKFHWKQLNFDLGNADTVKKFIDTGEFIPANNIPFGIEIWRNKLFITVPRRKPGIPATLSYIEAGANDSSPLLKPFPNLRTNQLSDGGSLVSVYRLHVDVCNRLWFVDTGLAAVNGSDGVVNNVQYRPTTLKIYDLERNLFLNEIILQSNVRQDSSLINLVVDVNANSCQNAYAYMTDIGSYGLVVYSLINNESWRIRHPYFYPDPLSCDYNIGGVNFQWQDGIAAVALSSSSVVATGYKTLYFHPISAIREYAISTKYLQDRTYANSSYHAYKVIGDRGPFSQAGASAFHEKTGVLFYPAVNKNAIGCWSERNYPQLYNVNTNPLILKDDTLLVYGSDLFVDSEKDDLWFISNRLPISIFSNLNFDQYNFHVFKIPISIAIQKSVCLPNNNSKNASANRS